MKRGTASLIALIAAVGVASLLVSTAAAVTPKKTIAFAASYSGTADVEMTDNIADIAAIGSGTGTLLGSSKLIGTGKGDSSTGAPGTSSGRAVTVPAAMSVT